MTGANVTGVIELADFSPGIMADFHGGITGASRGSMPRNGAAVIDGTYACCADSGGALVPLPKPVTGKSSQLLPQNDNTKVSASWFPASMVGSYIMDAVVTGPMVDAVNWNYATVDSRAGDWNAENRVSVYVLYQMFHKPDGSGSPYKHEILGRVYRQFLAVPDVKDFLWNSDPGTFANGFPIDLFSANLCEFRSYYDALFAPLFTSMTGIGGVVRGSFVYTGAGATALTAADQAVTTFDTDVGNRYPTSATVAVGNNFDTGFAFAHPRPTNVGFNTFSQLIYGSDLTWSAVNNGLNLGRSPVLCCSHQGRLVTALRITGQHGDAFHIRDSLWYTPALDLASVSPGFNGDFGSFEPAAENVNGIGVMASCNLDELLLIKHKDGGVLIRGDLDNPTVIRLRSIESTYGIGSTPVNTPIGLVYGSRNGVFVWQGGETSEKLSKQLDGFFWDHANAGDPQYELHRGRFAWFHPWVAVPNNYLFDTRTNAWWRLLRPADRNNVAYNVYSVDPTTGKMYAFPYKLTATQNVVWDVYDDDVLTDAFNWRSQPLLETLDKTLSFNEITLVASPGATTSACIVVVTLSGFNKDGIAVGPVSTVFQFTGTFGLSQPIIQRKDITANFNAMYVQCEITSTAAGGQPAPKIHRVNIGYGERNRSPKS